jgi:large subunit ribosomal protein L6
VQFPSQVKVALKDDTLTVEGPLGSLVQTIPPEVEVELAEGSLLINRLNDSRRSRTMQGLVRSLAVNQVKGVTAGLEKVLEIVGVGYRAEVKDAKLTLYLGFSKPMVYPLPKGVEVTVERQTRLTIRGADKQQVGQVAADIRGLRPPDVYKGKGIRYANEVVRRKVGKAGVK